MDKKGRVNNRKRDKARCLVYRKMRRGGRRRKKGEKEEEEENAQTIREAGR